MSLFIGDDSMILNALICDDEEKYINDIVRYFEKYCFEHKITCQYNCFHSGEDAMSSEEFYNIAFLDVEIGNVKGLQIAEKLKQKNKNIIIFFITAYEKYIDDAMNLFALRFLKKPLDYTRFYSGLDKAIELINEDIVEFYIKDSNKIKKIKANQIIYIETLDHKTKVVTEKQIYYSANLISYWEAQLTHSNFYRVHKSYILNMDYIDEYQRNEVKLINGEIVPIAYRNQSEFRKYFYNQLKKRR